MSIVAAVVFWLAVNRSFQTAWTVSGRNRPSWESMGIENQVEPRIIGLQEREHYKALQARRQYQKAEKFREQYARRAGVEGTHAQAIQRCGLRQCRYVGMAKGYLQHVLTAAVLNLVRIAEWWSGTLRAATRRSRFAALRLALA